MKNKYTYTMMEFCERFDITKQTFCKWSKEGLAPKVIKVKRRIFILEEEIQKWIKKMEKQL